MRVFIIIVLCANIFFLQAKDLQEDSFFDDSFTEEFVDSKPKKDLFDPLSSYNKAMTSFNDIFYIKLLTPVSKSYKAVLPQGTRICISNFFNNLLFPVRFTNNLLQLKIKNSARELLRFSVNSTFGIFGFFNVANIKTHDEDFGQTLGYYGVGSGFHVVLPFLGPSNLRDIVGLSVDTFTNPIYRYDGRFYNITKNRYQSIGLKSYGIINDRSLHIGEYESLKKDALILYPFLRDLYESKRDKLIKE
jgi:phospholipid-binding lipoprotein MlaA